MIPKTHVINTPFSDEEDTLVEEIVDIVEQEEIKIAVSRTETKPKTFPPTTVVLRLP